VSLGNGVSRARVVFNFAFNDGHIDRPVRFGALFKRPTKQVLRRERKRKGPRMFEASEIRKMLQATDGQLKAMLLLGINCALGNHDCASRSQTALDRGWVNYPRPKTGIDRRIPLWSETVAALREALKSRPLRAVVEHVHRWLFPPEEKPAAEAAPEPGTVAV